MKEGVGEGQVNPQIIFPPALSQWGGPTQGDKKNKGWSSPGDREHSQPLKKAATVVPPQRHLGRYTITRRLATVSSSSARKRSIRLLACPGYCK